MTLRCPKCKTPSLLSASEVGEVGRLERCPNCETTWLARDYSESAEGFGRRDRRPMTHREPPIIDAEFVPPIRFATGFHGQGAARVDFPGSARAGRLAVAAGATVLILILLAVALLTPAVSALPRLAGFGSGQGSVALEGVSSKTVTLRGTEAILVEGQIVNRSSEELDVPAIRIALKDGGAEVYSWLMEPTVERVAAGETVGFRSAMASPRPGATQIALSLADRGEAAAMER